MTANDAYLLNQVRSATPCGLIVMLHDGLIRFANEAVDGIKADPDQRSPRASAAVSRCTAILTELNASLHHDSHPQLCADLSELYRFFTQELNQSLKARSHESITKIVPLIQDLRNQWHQIDNPSTPQPSH
jgi:flagellar protein FliS